MRACFRADAMFDVDVLVVGSGYGGSVVAARLAPHCRLLVVERGRRWAPGEFPIGVASLARAHISRRNPLGLWRMALGAGTGNAVASGYGGGSLVNYGITSWPDQHVFANWPLGEMELEPYYRRACEVLAPEANPIREELGDTELLDWLEPGRRVDLENTIDWDLCTQCGRCVPGCNVGAKRSLDLTYLAQAERGGATVQTEHFVDAIHRQGEGVSVLIRRTSEPEDARWVTTRHLVLAAGTLGTLALLHKHRASISLASGFGRGLSMNGDALAFLYDMPHRLSGHLGAPISTSVRLPFVDRVGQTRTLSVMSGRLPMSTMRFAGAALATLGGFRSHLAKERSSVTRHFSRRFRDVFGVGPRGALSHSFVYKLDGQDHNRGTAAYSESGAASIDWPDYLKDPILRFADRRLREWAVVAGGTVVPNVATLPGMRSFGVHPLGGCAIGADVHSGVVDTGGRLFAPQGGVHKGIWVADGSIVPTSLGVPPSLTIAALAERVAETLHSELVGAGRV